MEAERMVKNIGTLERVPQPANCCVTDPKSDPHLQGVNSGRFCDQSLALDGFWNTLVKYIVSPSCETGTLQYNFRTKGFALLCAVFVFLVGRPVFSEAIPSPTGYINDYAGLLPPETSDKLERVLRSFEMTDSTQVVLLTVKSIGDVPIEDYSIKVVDEWKIGWKNKDNGVLLLVVVSERKIRIEVGRGLEGVLTDILAGRIIDRVITPSFKDGRFAEGIEGGIIAILQAVKGEYQGSGSSGGSDKRTQSKGSLIVPILFLIMILGRIARPLGIIGGALALPLGIFLLGGWGGGLSVLFLVLLSLGGGILGFFIPFLFAGFPLRGVGGFGGMGGFGSSGGLSGGGGRFGGGGASGGW